MEWIDSSPVLVTRTLNESCGCAAFGVGATCSIWKPRLGTRLSGSGGQLPEEIVDLFPHFRPARQSPPARPDDSNQPKALINRGPVILRQTNNAVDQQSFYVW